MIVYSEETTERRQISPLAITGAVVAVLVLALLLLLLVGSGERPLKPIRPAATPIELSQNSQAILVTFDELNANPYAFRNQRIRITGSYTPQSKPDCSNYKGLLIKWALISENLQLNGYGFETVLKLVPAGTSLTVEGIWRLYEGTVGCGKGAAPQSIWYLQVERIVQPNPLPGFGPAPDGEAPLPNDTPVPDGSEPLPTPAEGTAVSPAATPTPATTLTTTAITPLPTMTPFGTTTATLSAIKPTATLADGRVTATPGAVITNTPNPTNPAGTNTPPAVTTSGAATPTRSPLTTSTPGPSPTPGSGYPGPGITPTLDPYPAN